MVVVCRSAGTVVCLEYFQRDWIIQKCCVDCLPVAQRQWMAVKCLCCAQSISCLEVPGCWSATTMKDAGCDDAEADLCGC